MTATGYHHWLDAAAVDLVALPTVPLDSGGRAEAALLAHPPSYLRPIWHDAQWQVWKVRNATPIATGSGQVTDLDSSSVSVHFNASGAELIRIHASRLWDVSGGLGCVDTSAAGWLIVRARGPGTVTIEASVDGRLLLGRPDCDPG